MDGPASRHETSTGFCLPEPSGTTSTPENALRIGMLPNVPVERVSPVGNAAGLGAVLAVLDSGFERAENLSNNIYYVELSGRKDFNEIFVDNLALREG